MLAFLLANLLSAFVGVLIGVVFEDPLTQLRDGIVHQSKRLLSSRRDKTEKSEVFTFGGLRETTWRVVEGDGNHEYAPGLIRTHFDPRSTALPEDLAKRKRLIREQEEKKHQEGQSFWWNGERYCLEKFVISRTGLEEYRELELWFGPSDYYTFLATNMSLDDASLREKYIEGSNWLEPVPFFANSFGVSLIVVTQDEYTILTERSSLVGEHPREYNISMNEGLSMSLDRSTQGHAPDIYRCASPRLAEELGLVEPHEFTTTNILFLSFGVDTRYAQWGLLGMVKVNITATEILQRRAAGVKDKWENTAFHAVKFDLDSLIPFVLSKDYWLPNALVCIYHALVHEVGTRMLSKGIPVSNKADGSKCDEWFSRHFDEARLLVSQENKQKEHIKTIIILAPLSLLKKEISDILFTCRNR